MNALLRKLLAFLHLGVDGDADDPAPDTTAAPPEPAPAAAADTLDDLIDLDATDTSASPAAPAASADERLAAAERRAREAEERAERAEQRARATGTAAPSAAPGVDADFAAEEQQLAQARSSGYTPEQIAWLQFQIDTKRSNRRSEQNSRQALEQARELSDKTSFDQLATTKPNLHKRYAPRVEEIVNDLKAKGQPVPPRNVIIRALIGDDMINGKLTPKRAKPAEADGVQRVERQQLPRARSDVTGKPGAQTNKQKLEQRLLNVHI